MAELKLDFGFDRYERNARLKPALFTVLPILLFAAVWSQQVWTLMGGLLSLVVTCGATYIASRIARYRGRQVEQNLIAVDGALPSVRALRHGDRLIDGQTKARYHAFLRGRGLHIPDADEERLSVHAADEAYQSASKLLLELTRDKTVFPLIANENIDYGFRRNALGLRPIAIGLLVLVLIANTAAIAITAAEGNLNWTSVALEAFVIAALLVWFFVVKLDFVRDAGQAYAVRLLAACDTLSR